MKTILYVFAFVWFLLGLGALVSGQQFGMGVLPGGVPSVSGGAVPETAPTAWFWLWTFPMPALLAGALGALLGRLDEIREAIEFANEQGAPDDNRAVPEERVDPYIGEGYLSARPDTKKTSSER